jgi:dolichyl-phosphate-mannose--protein O-mannosyl transferase
VRLGRVDGRPVAIPLLLVLLAGGLRLARLDEPGRLQFDEVYYVGDAQDYLRQGVEEVRPAHPPVGKWLIAAGILVAGDDPFGWRVAPPWPGPSPSSSPTSSRCGCSGAGRRPPSPACSSPPTGWRSP